MTYHLTSALVYSILKERQEHSLKVFDISYNKIVEEVYSQKLAMPDYLKIIFQILSYWFLFSSLLLERNFFYNLPHKKRKNKITRWKHSSLSIYRDFIRFHENLVIFSLYSCLDTHV